MAGTGLRSARLKELDALRGLAALAVVVFHFTWVFDQLFGHAVQPLVVFPYGYLGVHLFFIISGFVILMTLDRTKRSSDFLISRFSRLFPVYWACVILTLIVVELRPLPELQMGDHIYPRPNLWEAIFNLTMLQGHFGIPEVDPVYWTLTVELNFYLLIFVAFKLGVLHAIDWIAACWVGVVLARWTMIEQFSFSGFALTLLDRLPLLGTTAHFFAAGMMFYRGFSLGFNWLRTGIIIACPLIQAFIGLWSEAIAAALFVVTFSWMITGRLRWLATRPFVWLGLISYPLYLIHQLVGYVIIRELGGSGIGKNLSILLATAAVITTATVLSFTIERPSMRFIRDTYKRIQQDRQLPIRSEPLDRLGKKLDWRAW